ncbi:MAG: hypothetical protein FWG68_05105 [Defluviitaleaceae bacterium]|nr:hypothetical protein [Defluviitaleaceae bacterium]
MSTKKLQKYLFENVKIVDIDGKVFTGFVNCYTSALDDMDGLENISIREYLNAGYLIDFTAADISTIEIIEVTEPPKNTPNPRQPTLQTV